MRQFYVFIKNTNQSLLERGFQFLSNQSFCICGQPDTSHLSSVLRASSRGQCRTTRGTHVRKTRSVKQIRPRGRGVLSAASRNASTSECGQKVQRTAHSLFVSVGLSFSPNVTVYAIIFEILNKHNLGLFLLLLGYAFWVSLNNNPTVIAKKKNTKMQLLK